MTTTIRMDMEQMWVLNRSVNNLLMTVSDQVRELAGAANTLATAWSGGYAEGYVNNLKHWLAQSIAVGKELQTLAGNLSREISEWEMVDSQKAFGTGHDETSFVSAGAVAALIAAGVISEGVDKSTLEKALGYIPNDTLQMGLEIYHRGKEDWAKYQDPSDRAAAIALDSAFVYGKAASKVAIVEGVTVGVTGALLCTPAAPLAIPLGMLAGAVSGFAFDWVADEAWSWLEDVGIKDAIVELGGDAIDWGTDQIKDGLGAIKDFGSGVGNKFKSGWNKLFGDDED